MKQNTTAYALVLALLLALAPAAAFGSGLPAEVPERLPVKGQVTFVDLGSERCPPCRAMKPTLREIADEYKGRAAIVYIDVLENHDWVREFQVYLIPTQLFFDAKGKLFLRHQGYMSKEHIQAVLARLGVPPAPKSVRQ